MPTAVPTTTPAPTASPVPSTSTSLPPEPTPACRIEIAATDPTLATATSQALGPLDDALVSVELIVGPGADVTIAFGGEWPTDPAPLAWTAPDRRTILVNPGHPATAIPPALAEGIAHELGHVLLTAEHVDDGTLLDPHLDGVITLGDHDRARLHALTCQDLPMG